ncbi:hypothetical protein HLH89_34125 [Rhizobium laguerreae]|uniref:cytochrome c-type biogenesis CcmF C-terminal domain-containing protein n=1 Tax=Rhizobium laguerreae TaxID=1076926 RepID=UPI0014792EE2|nr:cytochrome c-type biogenesis CcmF C-terminal domain-containing protein [Rhizobium laguerreae]NNH85973.1 hypothetical protein [Rhizobium laguerreae]
MPRSAFGTAAAHARLGVSVLGTVTVTMFETEDNHDMKPGEVTEVGGYSLRDDGMQPGRTIARSVRLRRPARRCRRRRHLVAKRLYTSRQTPTTEAGILIFSLNKLDVSLGDATSDDSVVVRIWEKPLILCTWGGALTMAIGGAVPAMEAAQ